MALDSKLVARPQVHKVNPSKKRKLQDFLQLYLGCLLDLDVLQVVALFAGKGEGEDGVGFVPSMSAVADDAEQQAVGVVMESTSFYAEGGGQVTHSYYTCIYLLFVACCDRSLYILLLI